ncbi:MAG TPA: dihydrodipicolinate synthase family protein [Candidatus Limnocylindrales bacterium]
MHGEAGLRGVYTILPTPFDDAGALDEPSLRSLVDFVIERGVHGLTILGVLGEASKLSDAERERVISITVDAVAGRTPVCVGTSQPGTDRCIALSRRAEALGAASLMVAPPALARPSEDAIRRHYGAVAQSVTLPIVVQDHPPSSGAFMTPAFLGGLAAELPACRWLKLEDEPTAPKISAVLRANPDVRVFGGLGGMFLLEELGRGAVGTMTGFAFPEVLVAVHRRCASGDTDAAAEVFYRYLPLIRFENQAAINLVLRKHVYWLRGAIASPAARAPFSPIDETTKIELVDLIDRLGLDPSGREVPDDPWPARGGRAAQDFPRSDCRADQPIQRSDTEP